MPLQAARTPQVADNSIAARPGTLTVVGCGIKAVGHFTKEAEALVTWADKVFFCASDPVSDAYIQDLNPNSTDLYSFYGNDKPRVETYVQMSEMMLREVRAGLNVVGVFYGHPGFFVTPSHRAIAIARREGHEARMLPAISALDCLFADLGVDPSRSGCQIVEATDLLVRRRTLLTEGHVVVLQVGSVGDGGFRFSGFENKRFSVLVEYLAAAYGNDHYVVNYIAAQYAGKPSYMDRVRIGDLLRADVAATVTGISTFYIPPQRVAPPSDEMIKLLGLKPQALGPVDENPFFTSPRAYEGRVAEAVAKLEAEVPPSDYRPSRPSRRLYAFLRDMALSPTLESRFSRQPEAVVGGLTGLSEEEREALLSPYPGLLRLVMQPDITTSARILATRMLREPMFAATLLQAVASPKLTHPAAPQSVLTRVPDAIKGLLKNSLEPFYGTYQLASVSSIESALTISASGLLLQGRLLETFTFVDGVLSWGDQTGGGSSGQLALSISLGSEEETLEESYRGPVLAGQVRFTDEAEQKEVQGKLGVYSPAGILGSFAQDPIEFWAGHYATYLLSPGRVWQSGPVLAVTPGSETLLSLDGVEMPRARYRNGAVTWQGDVTTWSGVLELHQVTTATAEGPRAGFLGRLMRFPATHLLDINWIGQRRL